MKVARNEKRKKLLGFSFYINIGNFEAFLWNLNLSANRLFWRCEDTFLNVENQSPRRKSSDKFCPILDTCQQIAYYFVFKKLCLYLKK